MALAPNDVRLILRVICLPTASVLPMGESATSTRRCFWAALGQIDVPWTNNTRSLTLVPALCGMMAK